MIASVFVVGPAGVGKSTFTGAFASWLEEQGLNVVTVNLDPGADYLPYEPDVDVRNWIVLSEIMKTYNLGPNGAQIVAADMLSDYVGEISDAIVDENVDYIIVDTPGQMELFAYRLSAGRIMEEIGGDRGFITFLMDPILSSTPDGFMSLLLLSASVHTRFYKPFMNVVTKQDLLSEEQAARISTWSESTELFQDELTRDEPGMRKEMYIRMLRALEELDVYRKTVFVSAKDDYGFEEIYTAAQMSFAGGEDPELL